MSSTLPHIGIITQARMTSSRLPGKIFKQAGAKNLLQYHLDRLKQTGFEIIVATTVNPTDDSVCDLARQEKVHFFRGSENNVLGRFHGAALHSGLEIIVRVTSDCPLIDPHLIRNSVEKYLKMNNRNLYMGNAIERTFARGFDFEIFSFEALHEAFTKAADESDLEHVTPYIWKNRSGKTELYHVKQEIDNSDLRITVDTPDDFELIRQLIERYNAASLSYNEIESLLRAHPELVKLNAHIEQKKV